MWYSEQRLTNLEDVSWVLPAGPTGLTTILRIGPLLVRKEQRFQPKERKDGLPQNMGSPDKKVILF